MRRLLAFSLLTIAAVVVFATSALAATPRPVVTKFSPATVRVGQVLTLTGKNFRSGAKNDKVYFRRASDGKTVRATPRKATKTHIEVVVPAKVTDFLTLDTSGNKVPTRFEIGIFTKVFGPYTKASRSPLIDQAGAPETGGGGPVPTTPPPPACPSTNTNADDDGDGLPNGLEIKIGTDPCKKDTDGDGVEDGYEYYSAIDLNGNNLPYPAKRPFPNPLDGSDAKKDFDGDGMSQLEEFGAWNLYGGRTLPTGPGQTFPYSDGNQHSSAPNGPGAMDLDNHHGITDDEKDADSDGIPNWIEMAKGDAGYASFSGCTFTNSTGNPNGAYGNAFTDCGAGPMPNGNTFGNAELTTTSAGTAAPDWLSTQILSYLDPDSDGDGIIDGADDNDFDGLSNLEEITAGGDGYYTEPQDPCDPNQDARACPLHPSHG